MLGGRDGGRDGGSPCPPSASLRLSLSTSELHRQADGPKAGVDTGSKPRAERRRVFILRRGGDGFGLPIPTRPVTRAMSSSSSSSSAPAPRRPPVLLGFRDAAARRLRAQPVASKLGGAPDRVPGATLTRPSCGSCGAGLMHVVQLYCPLEGSPFHRVLHVFACALKGCWGKWESWKVLRSQYLEVQENKMQECKPKQKQESLIAAEDWCDGADDWGETDDVALSEDMCSSRHGWPAASDPFPGEGDCMSRLQGLSLQEVPGDNPNGEMQMVPVWHPYYISAVEEEDYLDTDDTEHAQKLLKEYQQREGIDLEQLTSGSDMADSCGEKYEKSDVEKRDQVFHKFMKRISPCPEQILRYSWGGEPLLIARPLSDIKTAVPPCSNCHSKRIFECQLMPALISVLKSGDEDVSVEFGTALVYTCEKSCWPVNHPVPLEEFIFVQEDPDQNLFK